MKKGLVFILVFTTLVAQSQNIKNFDFGISTGFTAQRLFLKTTDRPNLTVPTVLKNGVGFDLLIMARYRFNKNLALRVMPGFSFQEFELLYKSTDETHIEKRELVEAVLPIQINYTWQTKTRIQPTLIAGATLAYNINPGNDKNRMAVNRTDLGVDIGVGGEIDFKKFKCRPELIYTFGNSNVSAASNASYNAIIRSLTRDRVTFRLIFFG
jgi:Outer membrane protein beta-barrel domain